MDTPLSTPPLPPKAVALLQQQGICTHDDLRRCGPVYAFLLLKAAGLGVTESLLWRLVCVTEAWPQHTLSTAQQQFWRNQVKQHPPVAVFPAAEVMQTWMTAALAQAQLALAENEVPVGAVVVRGNTLIAAAHNQCVAHHNISHHAEIQALSQASTKHANYRLDDCDVYITLEPCAMCASALMQARIRRVVFAAAEPKTGAAGSVVNLFAHPHLNTHTAVCSGILADESQQLLRLFFQDKRASAHSD